MSLTELGAAPFSLVDEINQGMDQRAERLVFDHMVQTTCQQKASQYFLITPKLLTGLQYHKLMRVLVVNNGDYLPEPGAFSCESNRFAEVRHVLTPFSSQSNNSLDGEQRLLPRDCMSDFAICCYRFYRHRNPPSSAMPSFFSAFVIFCTRSAALAPSLVSSSKRLTQTSSS